MKDNDQKRDPGQGGGREDVSCRQGGAGDPSRGFSACRAANECGLDQGASAPVSGSGTTVAAVASTLVVKVPSWFTAAAALRVAHLKGVDHLLVIDRQNLAGSVSTAVLATAPGHQPLERLMVRTEVTVSPDTPIEEAWRLMDRHGIDCLPVVVSGALLLGVVYRPDPVARAS
jgi:CBS domain-containing protein